MNYKISAWFGRFGNNMFQIANAIQLCEKEHANLIFPDGYTQWQDVKFNTNKITVYQDIINTQIVEKGVLWYDFLGSGDELRRICKNYILDIIDYEKQELSDNDLVIHIRGGDLFFLPEPPSNMNQAPFSYYKKIIESQKFDKIYIVHEDFLNPNVQLLKDTYENIILIDDLQMGINLLLSAKNLVSCGITTFSRMLALCSKNIEKHYIPGFFDGEKFNISPLADNTDVEKVIINVDKYFSFGMWRWNNDLGDFKERFIKNN